MANKQGTAAPGRGYEDTVKRQGGAADTGGRGVLDERRTVAEGHRDNLQNSKDDSTLPVRRKSAEEDDAEK